MSKTVHERLAAHLSSMGMGMPHKDALVDILKTCFTDEEAEIALLLPTTNTPLKPITIDELAKTHSMEASGLSTILKNLADKNLIFIGKTKEGQQGYALHQAGFGFPQAFFWDGKDTPHARKMTQMVLKYYNRQVTKDSFGGKKTKPYRYIPIHQSLEPEVQAVLPHDRMDAVLDDANRFALAHCPCRVEAGLMGRSCEHPLEVCLKFDEMADYLIDQGLGRKITREEAREIVRHSADIGLVHFVDNAAGQVKHNCNCCGCACWNVGSIRRRKIPRDDLMAVYFIRETDNQSCVGCGACIENCPVDALILEDDLAKIDQQWCIGCGVCAPKCDYDAVHIRYRQDREKIPTDFETLHETILQEPST